MVVKLSQINFYSKKFISLDIYSDNWMDLVMRPP